MTNRPRHNPKSLERLPGLFGADLRRLDDRLTHDAERNDVPPGLADRVFDASARQLPGSHLRLIPADQTSEKRRRQLWRRHSWGRVSLAASVGIAGAVALRMLQTSNVPVVAPPVALVTPSSNDLLSVTPSPEIVDALALSHDTETLLFGFMSDGQDDLSYLTLTQDLTLDDLAGEIVSVLAALNEGEM